MSFKTKTDYFNLATSSSGLVCVSDSDGNTATNVEAFDAEGTFIANELIGEQAAPTNDYVLSANWTMTGQKLGNIHTIEGKSFALETITITTAAGEAPKVQARGQQVEDNAVLSCSYSFPECTLPKTHHAESLLSAFTVSGSGCHLQSTTYTFGGTITKATKDGTCVAHDITGGRIDIDVSIIQTGSATPTVTPLSSDGWFINSPLNCTNPDANYATWSVGLTKYLPKDED